MKAGDIIKGKYRLVQQLGEGGMGTVWKAVHEQTGRKVALKLLMHSTEDLRQRMILEARACGALEHRNIIALYDVALLDNGDPFLVMQLLSGETLAERLSRELRFDASFAARIGADIASALACAHAANIIHRDLKPANIFLHREEGAVEGDFVVKVLDFGVSKNLALNDIRATMTGQMVGSLAYMSPEQMCRPREVDFSTDIWSLGVILFEMLMGARPFQGTFEHVVQQVATAPIPSLKDRVRHVPPELDEIVMRCLTREQGARIRDAAELSRMLAACARSCQTSRVVVNVASTPTPSSDGRPQMGSIPDAFDAFDDDEEATRIAPSRQISQTNELAPSGTILLSPTDPIASPMPSWRLEMQEVLAANRREESSTQPLGGQSPVGVTTTTLQLVQGVPIAEPKETTRSSSPPSARAPREKAKLYLTLVIGLFAIGTLGLISVFRWPSMARVSAAAPPPPEQSKKEALRPRPEPEKAPPPAPESKAVRPKPVVEAPKAPPPKPEPKASAAPAANAPPSPPKPPKKSQQPTQSNKPSKAKPPVRPPWEKGTSAPPAKSLPPCGHFFKTHCQPATK